MTDKLDTTAIRAQYSGGDYFDAYPEDACATIRALCDALDELRSGNERLQTIISNLHAVEEKHRETSNAHFHRANRLQVENERLREALKGMDLEAQRETVEAMLKPTLIHLVMKMSDDARATLAIMRGAAKGASDGGL